MSDDSGIRLAELVAAFSLATDLGFGQPIEHVLRSWFIAERIAGSIGLEADAKQALYYVITLAMVGCVAETPRALLLVRRRHRVPAGRHGCGPRRVPETRVRDGACRSRKPAVRARPTRRPTRRVRGAGAREDPHHPLHRDRPDGRPAGARPRGERAAPTGLRPLGRPRRSVRPRR